MGAWAAVIRSLLSLSLGCALGAASACAGTSGKLIQTGGVSSVEGAGGGGVATWATITGYGTREQVGANAHATQIRLKDFQFNSAGAAVGLFDRLELSFAEQRLETDAVGVALGLGGGFALRQEIVGLKLRLYGDALYYQDTWVPQVSVGAQFKKADHGALLRALGADDDDSVDFYLALTKVALAKSLMLSATVRSTEANQMGLLGFGGDRGRDRHFEFEGSAAWLPTRHVALGAEFRTNPDNLRFAKGDDYRDVFVALFPSKNFSLTFGYADLGNIGGTREQDGAYLSVQGGF